MKKHFNTFKGPIGYEESYFLGIEIHSSLYFVLPAIIFYP